MPRTMRDRIFTLAITCASRGMILRDRLAGRPHKAVDGLRVAAVRYWIPSGGNFLDAMLMEPEGRTPRAAVLICHGIGETVEHWRGAQTLLAEHGVASLVFNYSGYGRSSGRVDWQQWERDAVEAFTFLQCRIKEMQVSVLGYSLGSGVATAVMDRVSARGLVLCAAFVSLRKAAARSGIPEGIAGWLPDIWDNAAALPGLSLPVFVVHGAKDRLFPPAVARQLAASCPGQCEPVVVPGVSHNGPILTPDGKAQREFWTAVIERL